MKTSLVGGASAAAAIRSDAMGGGKEGDSPRECKRARLQIGLSDASWVILSLTCMVAGCCCLRCSFVPLHDAARRPRQGRHARRRQTGSRSGPLESALPAAPTDAKQR